MSNLIGMAKKSFVCKLSSVCGECAKDRRMLCTGQESLTLILTQFLLIQKNLGSVLFL